MANGYLEIRFTEPTESRPITAATYRDGIEDAIGTTVTFKGKFANLSVSSDGSLRCAVLSPELEQQTSFDITETFQSLRVCTKGKNIQATFSDLPVSVSIKPLTDINPQHAERARSNLIVINNHKLAPPEFATKESFHDNFTEPLVTRDYEAYVKVRTTPKSIYDGQLLRASMEAQHLASTSLPQRAELEKSCSIM